MFFSFYSNFLKNQMRSNLEILALQLSNSVLTSYEFANNSEYLPENSSCILIEEVKLKFPPKISSRNYEIYVQSYDGNLTITAKTIQEPLETVERKLPDIRVDFQGKIKSGESPGLSYYRCNLNNVVSDKIILGKIEFEES